jgi:hypothetical protein
MTRRVRLLHDLHEPLAAVGKIGTALLNARAPLKHRQTAH